MKIRNITVLALIFSILVNFPFTIGASSITVENAIDSEYPASIILLIGDGMGLEHIKFGQLVEYGENNVSSILTFPFNTTISTDNIGGYLTDSAAAGTAISTGVMTRNRRIATNWNNEMDLTTILEIAQQNGYATGLVATCHLTHATPASFAAHEGSRSSYQNIAEDFSQSNVDVFFGGGSNDKYMGEYIENFISQGYEYIDSRADLESVTDAPVLGLFTEGSFPSYQSLTEESTFPTLQEMTLKAIDLLNQTSKPFFLMVEGSQIDWASHDNDEIYLAHQIIEFEKTVRSVQALGQSNSDWLILVTADHETGGLSVTDYSFQTGIPLETDSLEIQQVKRTMRSEEIDVKWRTGGHTKTKVLLAGMGPYAEEIVNASHHVDTFSIMRMAVDGESEPIGLGYYDGYIRFPIYAWVLLSIVVITVPVTIVIIRKKKLSKQAK